MFDAQMFEEWLRKGVERSPNLYGGKAVHDVSAPGKARSVPMRPLGEKMHKERVEFDRKQATSDHDDGEFRENREASNLLEIPDGWYGYEPKED